jgi:hypothetical protein
MEIVDMTVEHSHAVSTATPFTEAELNTFHTSDRKEATVVVALIASIFCIGVVIYTIVAYSVVAGF